MLLVLATMDVQMLKKTLETNMVWRYNHSASIVPLKTFFETECCAEHNAIVSAFRYHADLTNCILYTTAPPCHKCARMIVQSGIKTVVYGKNAENQGGAEEGGGEGGQDSEEGGGEGGQDSEEEREESDEEDKALSEKVSAEEIFYWAKVATL